MVEFEVIITAMSVTLRGKKATGAWIGATDYPELIIGEKRDWLQRHRRKSKRRRLAAREKTGGPFKAECADRSNLGPIPASRVFLLFPFFPSVGRIHRMKLVSFRVYRQVVIVRVVDTRCGNGAFEVEAKRE